MEGRIHLLGTGTVVLEEQLCFTSDTVGAVVARTPCDNMLPPVWSQDLGIFWSQDLELVELV